MQNEYYAIPIVLALIAIAIEDFRQRQFRWIYLPVIFVFGAIKGCLAFSSRFWATSLAINVCVLFTVIAVLVFYYFITKRLCQIKTQFGLGDILLLLAIMAVFQPFWYIMVIAIAAAVSLLWHTAIYGVSRLVPIPFAAWLGVVSTFFITFEILM